MFIVLNLLGAAIGTSTSITHPQAVSYDSEVEKEMKDNRFRAILTHMIRKIISLRALTAMNSTASKISTPETVGTGKYLIYSHGHTVQYVFGFQSIVMPISILDLPVLSMTLRAHGENDKAICSMGGYEARTLIILIEDTFSRYGDVDILGLQGESMGTSTSLNALKYTDKVDFVVADCGFESLKFMVHDMYNDMYLYPFGTCADLGFKLIYGIDDAQVSGIDALEGQRGACSFRSWCS